MKTRLEEELITITDLYHILHWVVACKNRCFSSRMVHATPKPSSIASERQGERDGRVADSGRRPPLQDAVSRELARRHEVCMRA